MNIETLNDRDQILERQVLSSVLVSRIIPEGLISDYFCGSERGFFDEILSQFKTHGKIDIELIKNKYPAVYDDVVAVVCSMTGSDVAIYKLREHWQRREISRMIVDSIKEMVDPESVIKRIESRLLEIKTTGVKEKYLYGDIMKNVLDHIDDGMKCGKDIPGYGTNIHWLDMISGGIEKGKFYVIGGLKKTGKSRFLIHLGIQACLRGANLVFDSLEMSPEQLLSLCFSYFSGVNSREIGRKLSQYEYGNILSAKHKVNELNWMICREKYVEGLRSYINYQRQSRVVDIVFIDFIQRMRSERYKNDRVREVEHVSQSLADMSRELNVGVVALSQLSKDAEHVSEGHIPDMSCLKESQAIAENADSIWILHNSDRKKQKTEGEPYFPANMQLLVEQRYDVSGRIVFMSADMRTCIFNASCQDNGGII